MATTLQCNDEVFPGYVLSDRLGSGGYAEVWRARAPGGIEKAIKFVYGYYDEELAAQEMKAMERIKDVRHPFLLSLERFEVVDGRLAILTELADLSLDQRARQCRAEGHIGIPSSELHRYMYDAAEALDFLAQKHGLQHLDVKPENLLISGDHIKVADFGLVKELTSRTQNSLVAGMTPTYAAPEMYDDAPSAHSDQYSLAIVYQEMLTGTLPFPGRTAAQLAKQHTQSEPQLMALPPHDRSVVRRALAKNPEHRFPSCCAFVEALRGGNGTNANGAITSTGTTSAPPAPLPLGDTPTNESSQATMPRCTPPELSEDTQRESIQTTQHRFREQQVGATQRIDHSSANAVVAPTVVEEDCAELACAEETIDVAVPTIEEIPPAIQPTLYVAIGGVGIQALCRLRHLLGSRYDLDVADDSIQMAAFDTDRNELKEACARHWKYPLLHEDTLHLPLRLPKSYDEDCREPLGWLSRRWLYNIPRSLETRGFRALGRVALVDHGTRVRAHLDKRIAKLIGSGDSESSPRTIRAVILSGMAGGTSTGMVIDIAHTIRRLAQAQNARVDVHGFLLCTCIGQPNSPPLAVANSYAFLTELTHASEHGNEGHERATGVQALFESTEPPFDAVYCIPARSRGATSTPENDLHAAVRYIAAESAPSVGATLRACRNLPTEREAASAGRFRLRTLGFESLKDENRRLLHRLASELGRAIKAHWMSQLPLELNSVSCDPVNHNQSSTIVEATSPGASAGESFRDSNDANNGFTPERMQSRFGKYASTRFAHDVLSLVGERLSARDERGHPSYSVRQAQGAVAALSPAVGLLATNIAQPTVDQEISTNFHGKEMSDWVVAGSKRVLRRIIDEIDPAQNDTARIVELIESLIETECMDLLETELLQSTGGKTATALVDSTADFTNTVTRASAGLLQCGYDRRTILFCPVGAREDSVVDILKSVRPLAAVVESDLDDEFVICEGAGISPRSLARSLARLYPGIADAARRVHTRIDIDWKSL